MRYWGGGPKGMLAPPLKLFGGGPGPPGPPSSYAYENRMLQDFYNRLVFVNDHGCSFNKSISLEFLITELNLYEAHSLTYFPCQKIVC